MAVYSVEGKLGTGKTKFAVWRAQQALNRGLRVASNVDLFLDNLLPYKTCHYIRIPDKPSVFDLEAMGHGNPDSYDEDKNGVLILDELGTWLNSRSFQDKGRAAILDWLIHARKHGWDVYLIVQDANMIDKQVRESLIEYRVKLFRGDKIRLPLIGGILNDIFGGKVGYLPKFHLAVSRAGEGQNSVVAERWFFQGKDLHAGYDTRQVFKSDYPHTAHSVFHYAKQCNQSFFSKLMSIIKKRNRALPQTMYWDVKGYSSRPAKPAGAFFLNPHSRPAKPAGAFF